MGNSFAAGDFEQAELDMEHAAKKSTQTVALLLPKASPQGAKSKHFSFTPLSIVEARASEIIHALKQESPDLQKKISLQEWQESYQSRVRTLIDAIPAPLTLKHKVWEYVRFLLVSSNWREYHRHVLGARFSDTSLEHEADMQFERIVHLIESDKTMTFSLAKNHVWNEHLHHNLRTYGDKRTFNAYMAYMEDKHKRSLPRRSLRLKKTRQ